MLFGFRATTIYKLTWKVWTSHSVVRETIIFMTNQKSTGIQQTFTN